MSYLLLLLSGYCLSLDTAWSVPLFAQENAELQFEQFIQKHNKLYADEYEKQARFQIFKDNLKIVNRKNEKHNDVIFGITQFMDLTLEEFRNTYTGLKTELISEYQDICNYVTDGNIGPFDAPDEFDWRDHNVVTPIKDQKKCRSCYAFSAIANIESKYAIKYNKQIDLSEQQIVDCSQRNFGCGGGLIAGAFRYLIDVGGTEDEVDYHYYGIESTCRIRFHMLHVVLTDCNYYNLTSQEKLKHELYHNGPISIAIKSDGIQHLHNKTIVPDTACNVGDVNYAALLIGYGKEGDMPYWIVKNSWGTSWGDKGYFRMQRGENADSCGMMNMAMTSAIIE